MSYTYFYELSFTLPCDFKKLLQQCHTSHNLLKDNVLKCGIKVALVATNTEFNKILTQNSHKDATK